MLAADLQKPVKPPIVSRRTQAVAFKLPVRHGRTLACVLNRDVRIVRSTECDSAPGLEKAETLPPVGQLADNGFAIAINASTKSEN
jgi:hypothetical protein